MLDLYKSSIDFLYYEKYNIVKTTRGGDNMAKMGRPKADNPKSEIVTLRLLPEQKARLEAYARKCGLTKTQVVLKALELLEKEIGEQQ